MFALKIAHFFITNNMHIIFKSIYYTYISIIMAKGLFASNCKILLTKLCIHI